MYNKFARIKLASGRFYPIALGIDDYFRNQIDYLEETGDISKNHPLLNHEPGGEYGVVYTDGEID